MTGESILRRVLLAAIGASILLRPVVAGHVHPVDALWAIGLFYVVATDPMGDMLDGQRGVVVDG